jgi:WD40 repeat protein
MPLLLALVCLSPSAAPPLAYDVFGDPLPSGAVARMGTTRLRVRNPETVSFSGDGKFVITGSFDEGEEGAARFTFWYVRTGRRFRSVTVPSTETTSQLLVSGDGKTLAVVDSSDKEWEARFFDARTGKSISRLRGRGAARLLAISPDGKTAVIDSGVTAVWDVPSASEKGRLEGVQPRRGVVAFLPDGKSFVARNDSKLRLIRAADGKPIRDLEPDAKGLLMSLAVTPDGKYAVYRRNHEATGRVVELATGKEAHKWDAPEKPRFVGEPLAVAGGGRTLLGSVKWRVVAWDLTTGKRTREFLCDVGHRFALSADGKTVALVTFAAVRLYDVATGKPLHDDGHWGLISELAFSSDGKRLASWAEDSVRVWDASSGKELSRFEPSATLYLTHLRWDGGSLRWVDEDNAVRRWKPGERQAVKRTEPIRRGRNGYSAVCPNGEWLAVQSETGLRLESLRDRRRDRLLLDHPRLAEEFHVEKTFSSDSRFLAIYSWHRKEVIVFDVANNAERMLQIALEDSISAEMSFAPDGRSLLMRDGKWDDGKAAVYEVATGGVRFRLPQAHYGRSVEIAWTPDGRFLAARRRGNDRVFVFDTDAGKDVWKSAKGGRLDVGPIALSPDGRRLAVAEGTSILVWPLPTPAPMKSSLSDEKAWRNLGDADAAVAFVALRHFALAPDAAVKWFAGHLRLPPAVYPKRIARLIEQLDDDEFERREQASKELAKIGPATRDLLRAALKSRSLEVRRRAAVLLEKLAKPSPQRLRILRAVEALERIGTPPAAALLKKLIAGKPDAELKADVEATLERLRLRRTP